MDPVQRAFYNMKFLVDFLRKRGSEFQDWFVQIANTYYGESFLRVRPMGAIGDYKCDGYVMGEQIVFQCYAPPEPTERKLKEKIREDFLGAESHWKGQIKKWVLVLSDVRGLGPMANQEILLLSKQFPEISFRVWGENEIRNLTMSLTENQLQDLWGLAPTQEVFERLSFEDIRGVVSAIEAINPENIPLNAVIPLVSRTKLEKNNLSEDVADFLRMGRKKEVLVQEYFDRHCRPDFGERIAQTFQKKYQELKGMGFLPDDIFSLLQEFSGKMNGTPKRQSAVLAVMSYLFERCDIFEDIEKLYDITN